MDLDNDVQQPVIADDSVNQEIAPPVSGVPETPTDKEMNFRALEAERDKYRGEADSLRSQAQESKNLTSMYQQMGYSPNQQQAQGNVPQSPAPQIPSNGLNFENAIDSDAFDQMNGHFSKQAEQMDSRFRQQSEQLEQMQLAQHDPNWRATIEQYLPEVLQQNPWMGDVIKTSPQAWKMAYHYATNNPTYYKSTIEQQQSTQAEKMVQNAVKPQSLGTVGVQANVGGKRPASSLSDAEFAEAQRQISAGTYNP